MFNFNEIIRFGIVGVISNILIYCLYLTMTLWNVPPKVAMSFAFLIGTCSSFISNKKWTFADKSDYTKTAYRFIIAYAVVYIFNLICMWIAVDYLHVRHYIYQGISILVFAVILFFVQKYWIFNTRIKKQI